MSAVLLAQRSSLREVCSRLPSFFPYIFRDLTTAFFFQRPSVLIPCREGSTPRNFFPLGVSLSHVMLLNPVRCRGLFVRRASFSRRAPFCVPSPAFFFFSPWALSLFFPDTFLVQRSSDEVCERLPSPLCTAPLLMEASLRDCLCRGPFPLPELGAPPNFLSFQHSVFFSTETFRENSLRLLPLPLARSFRLLPFCAQALEELILLRPSPYVRASSRFFSSFRPRSHF